MQKKRAFALFCLFFYVSPWSYGQTLPVVQQEYFEVGRFWVWNYYKGDTKDLPYSSERYRVTQRKGPLITLIISTKNIGSTSFRKHHKIIVDLNKCHRAYRNRVDKKPWRVRSYHYQNKWVEYFNPSNKIFEEKFNCDPHVRRKKIKTHYAELFHEPFGKRRLFAQVPFGNSSNVSWYDLDSRDSKGVLIRKDFNKGSSFFYQSLLESFGERH